MLLPSFGWLRLVAVQKLRAVDQRPGDVHPVLALLYNDGLARLFALLDRLDLSVSFQLLQLFWRREAGKNRQVKFLDNFRLLVSRIENRFELGPLFELALDMARIQQMQ